MGKKSTNSLFPFSSFCFPVMKDFSRNKINVISSSPLLRCFIWFIIYKVKNHNFVLKLPSFSIPFYFYKLMHTLSSHVQSKPNNNIDKKGERKNLNILMSIWRREFFLEFFFFFFFSGSFAVNIHGVMRGKEIF